MEVLIKPILESWGTPRIGMAIVYMLFKLNSTINFQRDETIRQFHSLDKRITVMEAKSMFDNLPSDYSAAVKTPDPVVVKIVPSDGLLFIVATSLIVAAAWESREKQ